MSVLTSYMVATLIFDTNLGTGIGIDTTIGTAVEVDTVVAYTMNWTSRRKKVKIATSIHFTFSDSYFRFW